MQLCTTRSSVIHWHTQRLITSGQIWQLLVLRKTELACNMEPWQYGCHCSPCCDTVVYIPTQATSIASYARIWQLLSKIHGVQPGWLCMVGWVWFVCVQIRSFVRIMLWFLLFYSIFVSRNLTQTTTLTITTQWCHEKLAKSTFLFECIVICVIWLYCIGWRPRWETRLFIICSYLLWFNQ